MHLGQLKVQFGTAVNLWSWATGPHAFVTSYLSLPTSAAEILQANDSLTQVINQYKLQVRGEEVNGNNTVDTHRHTGMRARTHKEVPTQVCTHRQSYTDAPTHTGTFTHTHR